MACGRGVLRRGCHALCVLRSLGRSSQKQSIATCSWHPDSWRAWHARLEQVFLLIKLAIWTYKWWRHNNHALRDTCCSQTYLFLTHKKKTTFFVHEIETSALIFRTEEIQVISWVDGYEKWERIKVWTQDLLTCSQPLNSHASNCTNSTCVKQKTFSRLLSESTVFIPYPYFISSLLLWTSYSIVLFFFFQLEN